MRLHVGWGVGSSFSVQVLLLMSSLPLFWESVIYPISVCPIMFNHYCIPFIITPTPLPSSHWDSQINPSPSLNIPPTPSHLHILTPSHPHSLPLLSLTHFSTSHTPPNTPHTPPPHTPHTSSRHTTPLSRPPTLWTASKVSRIFL